MIFDCCGFNLSFIFDLPFNLNLYIHYDAMTALREREKKSERKSTSIGFNCVSQ